MFLKHLYLKEKKILQNNISLKHLQRFIPSFNQPTISLTYVQFLALYLRQIITFVMILAFKYRNCFYLLFFSWHFGCVREFFLIFFFILYKLWAFFWCNNGRKPCNLANVSCLKLMKRKS